jgi:hypothetical protein
VGLVELQEPVPDLHASAHFFLGDAFFFKMFFVVLLGNESIFNLSLVVRFGQRQDIEVV